MNRIEADVIVLGSGFGAAAPALRLAEAGFSVAVIEKGPRLDPMRDFRRTQDPSYFRRYLKSCGGPHLSMTWAEAFGGGSGFYEMVSLRAPSRAFQQVDERGTPLWPSHVDRRALDPYFERAEAMLTVEQIPLEQVPRTGLVFAQMLKNLGYSCERARYAVRGCVGIGYCVAGCVFRAKQALFENYWPAAEAAGVRVHTDLEARSIRTLVEVRMGSDRGPMAGLPHRYEIECVGTGDGERTVARGRVVVLAAGTVGSASLLLRSRGNLPLLSAQVGRNLCFNGSVKTAGLLPPELPDGDLYSGRSHPGVVSYEFLDSHGVMVTAAKALPLQIVSGVRMRVEGEPRDRCLFGEEQVELMRRMRRRGIVLVAFGFTPPAGRMTVDEQGRPGVEVEQLDVLRRYQTRTRALLHSILRRNGCQVLELESIDSGGQPHAEPYFSTTHHVGSCRMAERKEHGVVDANGEVFDYPGLFVSDGAAIPSSLAVNSALTILANAERIADGIVERYHGRRETLQAGISCSAAGAILPQRRLP